MQRNYIVLSACVLMSGLPMVWAAGGGNMSMPRMNTPQVTSTEDQAKSSYNDGVRDVRKADKYQAAADEQSDPKKKEKALREAREHYTSALGKFTQAVKLDPRMHEAWNYVGYTNRKLGEYDISLAAYERALALHPGYPEALEYRGEAFLALHRISDAQQAYLDLFSSNRQLADKLLAAMKGWVNTQRTASAGSGDATAVDALDKWVQERAQIAGQTASLTRAGAASSWR
ncbi:MAG TPA: tetratricopeptide repeat protein [Steroidobacteraceae bacterium]